MKGTEKQIKWAEAIVAKAMKAATMENVFAILANRLAGLTDKEAAERLSITEPVSEEQIAEMAAGIVAGHDDAAWWIENRNTFRMDEEIAKMFLK